MLKIKSERYKGYKNIYALNGLSFKDQSSLYKYMPYSRFVSSVRNNELVFVSPSLWIDPFERRFWATDYRTKYGFIQPDIFCMCLTTKSTTNEDASWKMYVDSKERAVRISYKLDNLLLLLDDYADKANCKIYIGKAIYDFERKEIEGLHKKNSEFFPSTNVFNIENYLSLMCIKRKSFQFENEIRVFIVKEEKHNDDIIKVPVVSYKDIVARVMIGPLTPFSLNDPRFAIYNKIQYLESLELKKEIKTLIKDCDVKQSKLYVDNKPLKSV